MGSAVTPPVLPRLGRRLQLVPDHVPHDLLPTHAEHRPNQPPRYPLLLLLFLPSSRSHLPDRPRRGSPPRGTRTRSSPSSVHPSPAPSGSCRADPLPPPSGSAMPRCPSRGPRAGRVP